MEDELSALNEELEQLEMERSRHQLDECRSLTFECSTCLSLDCQIADVELRIGHKEDELK